MMEATDDDEWMMLPREGTPETNGNSRNKTHSPEDGRASAEVNPLSCLFCKHVSQSVEGTVEHLYRHHGFFVPNPERLFDWAGLLGYCRDEISVRNRCLFCQRRFRTSRACQDHMKSTRHTKLRCDETGVGLIELNPFYIRFDDEGGSYVAVEEEVSIGFSMTDETWAAHETWAALADVSEDCSVSVDEDITIIDDGRTEASTSPKNEPSGADLYLGGSFVVDRFGSLLFPNGRAAGHRELRQYYKQRYNPARFGTDRRAKTTKRKQDCRKSAVERKEHRETTREVRLRNMNLDRMDKKQNRSKKIQASFT